VKSGRESRICGNALPEKRALVDWMSSPDSAVNLARDATMSACAVLALVHVDADPLRPDGPEAAPESQRHYVAAPTPGAKRGVELEFQALCGWQREA
jgi:hypothetical protein